MINGNRQSHCGAIQNHSMTKLWGGRFSQGLDPHAHQFNASLTFDRRLWSQDIRGSIGWAKALARGGVITEAESGQIILGLQQIHAEFSAEASQFAPTDEDIHTAVERRLTELIGPIAGKLHTGRSRNDQVATDFRLWVMEAEDKIIAHIRGVQRALLAQAESHVESLMPGYTHLQRAQPVTFGHWLMGFFWALERDHDRWTESRIRASVCPFGSAALAGSAYPIDRLALAADLGFSRVSENSLDAVSDRDFAAEFLFNAALTASHLSRLAEGLIIFSSAEFGFVTLADAYATGSSLMPQKKNPDVLELTRGKAGTLIGLLTGLLAMLKGLPSAYDKDLQEDKPPVFAAFDTLDLMLPVLAGAIATITVNADRMAAALDTSLLATELADYLVRKGLPFREAHHIVGQVVQKAECEKLERLSLEALREINPVFAEDVAEVWDFRAALNRRNLSGGTGVEAMRNQIRLAQTRLMTDHNLPKHEE
jgi:argininosuccinate lyase